MATLTKEHLRTAARIVRDLEPELSLGESYVLALDYEESEFEDSSSWEQYRARIGGDTDQLRGYISAISIGLARRALNDRDTIEVMVEEIDRLRMELQNRPFPAWAVPR